MGIQILPILVEGDLLPARDQGRAGRDVGLDEGLADLLLVEGAGPLQDVIDGVDGGVALGTVRRQAIAQHLGELLVHRLGPVRHLRDVELEVLLDEHVLDRLDRHRLVEIRVFGAGSHRVDPVGNVEPPLVGLLGEDDMVRRIHGDDQRLGLAGLDLQDLGGEVHRPGRVGLIHDDFKSHVLGELPDVGGVRLPPVGTLYQDADAFRALTCLLGEGLDGLELLACIVDGHVIRSEGVLEAALGDDVGHRAGHQPGSLVPLGHLGGHGGHGALVGAEHERDVLARDDALGLGGPHVGLALGVRKDEPDLGPAQGRDPTLGVDLVRGDDGAGLGLDPLICRPAGERQDRSELDLGHLLAGQDRATAKCQGNYGQANHERYSLHCASLLGL